MMDSLRQTPPTQVGKYKVLQFKDILNNIIKNLTGETREAGLPKSNVLYFTLEKDAWCCVRPSGTEPKIKLYFGVKEETMENAEKELKELKHALEELVK